MNRYLKAGIITGIMAVILLIFLIRINAQPSTDQYNDLGKILTEISVDIKYIKSDINEIKQDNRGLKSDAIKLGSRVTRVEERQVTIKENIYSVTERNNWITGIIGSVLILMLGLQLKRSYSHRKNNGKESN